MWPLAFIALVPLLYVIATVRRREAFIYALLSGFVFFLGLVFWLIHVSLFGMFFVASVCSLYWGLFGIGAHMIINASESKKGGFDYKSILTHTLALAACWVSIEYIRAEIPYVNFGWALLAYSQSFNSAFIQIANMLGAYGVSFFVVLCNGFIFYAVHTFKGPRKTFLFCFVDLLLILIVVYSYGFMQLNVPQNGKQLRVGVVQANIPQALKWNPAFKDEIINTYVKLIEFISYDEPDLVVLPEAAYPGNFVTEFTHSRMNTAVKDLGRATLVGGIRFLDYEHEYNSAFLLSKKGTIEGFYDKINLVPFGEYIPFKIVFDLLGLTKVAYSLGVSDFSRGEKYTVFPLTIDDKKFYFSTLICFEDVFPYLARRFVDAGAEFLVVITNDAWFGKTAAAHQHMQASIFRAVENNCYVVRAANTGVSGFISPRGKVLNTVSDKNGEEIFVVGGVSRPLLIAKRRTFFQYGGFAFKYLCVAFLCLYMVRRRR